MMRAMMVGIFLQTANALFAQQDSSLTRQCSAIREIIYQSTQSHFNTIIDQRISGSRGYQVNGAWTFSNEHFSTTLPWAGAANTIIEHSTDNRDSIDTESWQYIATFQTIGDPATANRYYRNIIAQINDCVLPLNDSISVNLQPIDPSELPPTKPDNLSDAFLFVLPGEPGQTKETSIMVGLERTRRGYQPVLMVELLEEKKKF